MKVFAVFEGYEDLIGVFSTREKAEDYIRSYMVVNPSMYGGRERYSILDHTLDNPSADREGA